MDFPFQQMSEVMEARTSLHDTLMPSPASARITRDGGVPFFREVSETNPCRATSSLGVNLLPLAQRRIASPPQCSPSLSLNQRRFKRSRAISIEAVLRQSSLTCPARSIYEASGTKHARRQPSHRCTFATGCRQRNRHAVAPCCQGRSRGTARQTGEFGLQVQPQWHLAHQPGGSCAPSRKARIPGEEDSGFNCRGLHRAGSHLQQYHRRALPRSMPGRKTGTERSLAGRSACHCSKAIRFSSRGKVGSIWCGVSSFRRAGRLAVGPASPPTLSASTCTGT